MMSICSIFLLFVWILHVVDFFIFLKSFKNLVYKIQKISIIVLFFSLSQNPSFSRANTCTNIHFALLCASVHPFNTFYFNPLSLIPLPGNLPWNVWYFSLPAFVLIWIPSNFSSSRSSCSIPSGFSIPLRVFFRKVFRTDGV